MGIELELIILILIQLIGSTFFARFEIETPAIKKVFKWLILDAITIGLFYLIHHYAILFPVVIVTIGTIVHFRICKKNGINPFNATPRKKYYQLRGWKWQE
ncbi:MAG TPA: hypothetical protein PK431_08310 [Chitinophagales bacterium]|jgi:hypothetical protein|nr:hypothetical protein [Chitinophagales bacterium]